MTHKDFATIAAVAFLVGAAVAALNGFGISAPASVVLVATLIAGIVIALVRIYVAIVGPDNTQADEELEAGEDKVLDIAAQMKPANAKAAGKPPAADNEPPPEA